MKHIKLSIRWLSIAVLLLSSTIARGQSGLIEYWFDDNIQKKASIPVNTATDALQIMRLDLSDATKFPLGFHRLNMRVAAGGYSPIYSALVMRLPDGQHSELTYWLDDNYNGRRVVKGITDNGVKTYFAPSLDLSSASSGMHRLKFRITTNGFDDGVIYEEPILVTRLYSNQGVVYVEQESHWLDELISIPTAVFNPQQEIVKTYTLNPNDYTVGQHIFHAQFKNSSGVWSVPNETYFYKENSGKLYAGRRPDDATGIDLASEETEKFSYNYYDGILYINCQSPRLSAQGVIAVYDYTGRELNRQTVNNSGGLHAQVDMNGLSNHIVIVRIMSGDVQINKKIIVK